jgi:hypothetical protein
MATWAPKARRKRMACAQSLSTGTSKKGAQCASGIDARVYNMCIQTRRCCAQQLQLVKQHSCNSERLPG